MILDTWAYKHDIPIVAVAELRAMLGLIDTNPSTSDITSSEGAVQNLVRLEGTRKGCRLWRNNVGAVETDDGRFIRYGICNDSKRMNQSIKSSDLIGIRPVVIESHHLGRTLGQFIAREVKHSSWQYRGTERELAQLKFIELVTALGGDACFANGEGTI